MPAIALALDAKSTPPSLQANFSALSRKDSIHPTLARGREGDRRNQCLVDVLTSLSAFSLRFSAVAHRFMAQEP